MVVGFVGDRSVGVGPNVTPPRLLYEICGVIMPPLTLKLPLIDATIVPLLKIQPPILFEVFAALEILPLTLRVFEFPRDSVTPPVP